MVEKDDEPIIRNPDIAFWFDDEDITLFEVKMQKNLPHVCIVQAYFYLLSVALETYDQTTTLEWERKE